MKILFLAVGDRFGSGKALVTMVKQLKSLGHDCFVISSDNLGLDIDLENICDNMVIRSRFCIYPILKRKLDYFFFPYRFLRDRFINIIAMYRLYKFTKLYNPDIIHSNTSVLRLGIYVSRLLSIPHVWHVREYQSLDMGYKPLGGKKKIEHLFSINSNYPIFITKGLMNYYNNPRNGIVIYDGVNKPIKSNCPIKKSNPYFLFIGNITEHKGCSLLIDSYIEFVKKYNFNIDLYIAGDYNNYYARKLKEQCKINGVEERVRFLGFIDNKYEYMSNAIAQIVPSKFECFGLTTVEAMLSNCLVIGKNTAGTKEQFDNGVEFCGKEIGIRFNDKEELINSLYIVSQNLIESDDIKQRAYNVVSQLYSPEENISKIISLYQKIENNRIN